MQEDYWMLYCNISSENQILVVRLGWCAARLRCHNKLLKLAGIYQAVTTAAFQKLFCDNGNFSYMT